MCHVLNYNRLNDWPLQFLRTGYYRQSYGYIQARTEDGNWWSSTASSNINGYHLASWAGAVYAQRSYFQGYGFALRCEGGVRFWLFRTPQKSK